MQEQQEKTGPVKRLFQHSAIYSISTSVQRLQGLILTPVYTSAIYLPEMSQYSNYGLIYTFIAFMNFVYLYGMDSAFLRFFFLGKTDRKTVFSSTFFILVSSGILTSICIFIFSGPISSFILFSENLAPFVRLAALILLFDTIGNLPYLILRAEERSVTYTVFRLLRFSIELGLNVVFVVILKKGVFGILYANLAASLLNLLIMMPFTLKYLRVRFDVPLLGEMVRFGLPFLPNGIAFMTIEMVDRFLVTEYLGKDTMAFYHSNYKFASILLLLIVGFRNAWQPFFLKIANRPGSRQTYSRILNYYLLLASLLTVFVTFFIRDLLMYRWFDSFYLLGQNYWPGIPIIPWIVLSYLFFGIYVIFTPAFYITKKSRYMVLFTGTGAILNLIVNLILLPRVGVWGAVTATVTAYFSMSLFISIVAQKIYPIPLNLKKVLSVFLLVGLGFFIYYIVSPNLTFRIILFLLMVLLAVLLITEKNEIKKLLTSFKLK